MKHTIFSLILAMSLLSCNNKQANSSQTEDNASETIAVNADMPNESESSIETTEDNEKQATIKSTTEDIKSTKTFLISKKTVDNVSIGESIEKFKADIEKRYTVKKESIMQEGDSYEILSVYEKNNKLYSIEPDQGEPNSVYRIWIYSPKFKTEQGIGVGSTLSELKSKYDAEISTEVGLNVFIKEISGNFVLDYTKIPESWWNTMDMKKLPADISIREILLY
jgi:hypothetical protein